VRSKETSSSGISTLPANDGVAKLQRTGGSVEGLGRLPAGFYAGVVLVLVAASSLSLFPLWQILCRIWVTDPLRSIGAVFPLVACVGVLTAWRRLGWCMDGTFWALPLVALSILLTRVITISPFIVGYDGQRLGLMNLGMVLFLYASGAVLLFGGTRLLRASIAPLCLLLFVNPVPGAFNSMVDLPLQHLSASTARSFAHLISIQPTGAQLRMMFAPDFGMFIAPGCNGVRGSITLGYLALIFGYTRRLRHRTLVLVTLAALLLGYALNLLRLCVLVIYYRIGVSFPSIQKHGTGIDYAIGCTLFLFAALGLGLLIRSLEPGRTAGNQRAERKPAAESPGSLRAARPFGYAAVARSICFLALTAAFIIPEIRAVTSLSLTWPNEQQILGSFPTRIGAYRLTRTWAEHSGNGMIVLAMAEYSASPDTGDTANSFTFGLWVGSGNHLVANSKLIQGILGQWTGSFDATARQALPVHFVTSFYDDGISRQYDAESTCFDSGCSGHLGNFPHNVGDFPHKGFFFTAPAFSNLDFAPRGKRLPILLRREWLDSDPTPSSELCSQFEADARLFMAQVDLRSLLAQDGSTLIPGTIFNPLNLQMKVIHLAARRH
jgi:exosortase J